MDMKPAFDDVQAGPTPQQQAFMERQRQEQPQLKQDLLDFVAQELPMVKGLASQSKKDLAREVVHLRGMVKTIKKATEAVTPGAAAFGHAEAFRLMEYTQTNAAEGEEPVVLHVWNSRDGVTPFIVHIGAQTFQCTRPMGEMLFDLPAAATHKWVTRTDREVLVAWQRTLTKAVEQGKLEADKAETMRDNLAVARSWHYGIGLVNLATGKFTDEEVLADA